MTPGDIATGPLRDAIARLTAPSPAEGHYRIGTTVNSAFLARSRSGAPTLLIPLATVPVGAGRRGGGFALTPAACVAFDYGGRKWEQPAAAFECTESELIDVFLVLVVDLGRRLASSRAEITWQTIVAWLEEWQSLLAHRVLLSTEHQLGLWGELWVISNARTPDALVAAWRGPEQEAADFFLDGVGLEIKASRRAHVHHVSQRQIEKPVGAHGAYLLSLWVGVDPARGVSLCDLVNSTLARVADPPKLLKTIGELGYAPVDCEQYATKWIPLEAPRWFRAEDIPRVRAIDPGISQVRFVVTLDTDRALVADAAERLWRHFCGAEPAIAALSVGVGAS